MIRTNHQCHLDAPVWINAQQAISLLQWFRSRSDTPAANTHASESTGCEFEPEVGHLNQKVEGCVMGGRRYHCMTPISPLQANKVIFQEETPASQTLGVACYQAQPPPAPLQLN